MATHRLSTLHPTSCYPKYSLRKKSRHIPKFLIFFLEPVSMVYQPFTLFDVMGTNFSRRLRYLPHPCEVPLSSKMGQWKRSCRKKSLKHLRINQSLKKKIAYMTHPKKIKLTISDIPVFVMTKWKSICLLPNCVGLTPTTSLCQVLQLLFMTSIERIPWTNATCPLQTKICDFVNHKFSAIWAKATIHWTIHHLTKNLSNDDNKLKMLFQ